MNHKPKAKVLICDDDHGIRKTLETLLNREGFSTQDAERLNDGKAKASNEHFDLVLCDLSFPDGIGLEMVEHAQTLDPRPEVILITAYGKVEQAVEAMRLGAYDFIQKPFKNQELLAVIDKALEKKQLADENKALKAQLHAGMGIRRIVGGSDVLAGIKQDVLRMAQTRTNVLITGESGTGKEVLARAIHEESGRKGKFLVVNCGAIPENLMESELFGHVRGAFTHASTHREGLFVAAENGTVFLDEISEMPLSLQVKLLRVIQERKVKPVGSNDEKDVDVRIISATNRTLEEEVKAGRFREDLYYRLNVMLLHLPPLRERVGDIPQLVETFRIKHGERLGKEVLISPSLMEVWKRQAWKGNIRELENAVERAMVLSQTGEAVPDVLSEHPSKASTESIELTSGFNLELHLESIERAHIQKALLETSGNKTRAAELLGMSFRQFRYRTQKLNVE